jgi:hypothetical protein
MSHGAPVYLVAGLGKHPTVLLVELYAWQAGLGRGWPMSTAEEYRWVRSLPERACAVDATRHDVTTALMLLREGAVSAQPPQVAEHVDMAAVRAAYLLLNSKLSTSLHAWRDISLGKRVEVVVTEARRAACIAEVPATRISIAAGSGSLAMLAHTTTDMAEKVENAILLASAVEDKMDARDGELAGRLGRSLHNPHTGGLWANQYFIPTRVGQLCPTRVANLLGERIPS